MLFFYPLDLWVFTSFIILIRHSSLYLIIASHLKCANKRFRESLCNRDRNLFRTCEWKWELIKCWISVNRLWISGKQLNESMTIYWFFWIVIDLQSCRSNCWWRWKFEALVLKQILQHFTLLRNICNVTWTVSMIRNRTMPALVNTSIRFFFLVP